MDQTINLIIRIFCYRFFDCQVFFKFNNTTNHVCFVENTFLTVKINLDANKKQFQMRNRFNNAIEQI